MSTRDVRAGGAPALLAPLAVGGALLAATTVVAVVDPHESGAYPTCPFLALTGHPCPMCGGLRAVNSLAHGDLSAAVGSNVLAVALVALAGLLWVRWVVRRTGGQRVPFLATDQRVFYGGLAVLLVFGVLRNLPFAAALAP